MQALQGIDGYTAYPLEIDDYDTTDSWSILHIWEVVDCFDEEKSQFKIRQPDDPVRPDLAGDYKAVTKTRIDPARTAGKHIFRIARLDGTIVVSENLKQRFEKAGVTGAVFQDVTGA